MTDFAWWDLPDDCPHCGRPLMSTEGQTMINTVEMDLLPEGYRVYPETRVDWCGACVEEWNERLT